MLKLHSMPEGCVSY